MKLNDVYDSYFSLEFFFFFLSKLALWCVMYTKKENLNTFMLFEYSEYITLKYLNMYSDFQKKFFFQCIRISLF